MKKLLAVLLSLCLVVGMVPMMAFADDGAAASSDWVYGPDYPAWYVGEDGYDWSEYWKSLDMDERDAYEWWLQHGGHWGGYWDEYYGYVASIGDVWYHSLDNAIKAATDGTNPGTIKLYKDVSYRGTLPLSDVVITGVNNPTIYANIETGEDSVNINDLTISGTITTKDGSLFMNNVTMKNSGVDIYVEGAGTVNVPASCKVDSIKINTSYPEGSGPNVVTSLEPVYDNAGKLIGYTSNPMPTVDRVAAIGNVYYDSLADALEAASKADDGVDGDPSLQEVTLLKNDTITGGTVNENVRLVINSGVTLRVNGTLTVNGDVYNYGEIRGNTTGNVYNYVRFRTSPSGASVTVYDGDYWHNNYYWGDIVDDESNGVYWLPNGTYYYEVRDGGYIGEADWFRVDNAARTINVSLDERVDDYRVYVEDPTHGDISVDKTRAEEGDWVYITVDPDVGYVLTGITVTKPNGSTVKVERVRENYYRFEMPGTRVTVDASFSRHVTPFTDIRLADWYYEAVSYVYFNGLMEGVTDTEFAPNAATSRAMVVQILYRMSGSPSVSGSAGFTDVASGAWYATAVNWAADRGIVEGRTASTFDPNAAVTREELATMLYRYARFKGYNVSVGENTNILSYNDVNQVSDYAYSAMQWACGTGIIDGTSSGYLTPQGGATRAQLAAMLMRFCNEYVD